MLDLYVCTYKASFDCIKMFTKIKLDPTQVGKEQDVLHIDFLPSSSNENRCRQHTDQFEQLLHSELMLQNLDIDGHLEE